MKKSQFLLYFCFLGSSISAQIVAEKHLYKSSNNGEMQLRDVVVDDSVIIETGDFNLNEGQPNRIRNVIISTHDSLTTGIFHYHYQAYDDTHIPYETFSNSIVKSDSGYITAGYVRNSGYYGSTAPGGADMLFIKTDLNGNVLNALRIDLGGLDIAHAIKRKNAAGTRFVVSGMSDNGNGTAVGVVMEIDKNLNVIWSQQLDLRINVSTATYLTLFDVVYDGTDIWSVGSLRNYGSGNSEGVVVRLNSGGTVLAAHYLHSNSEREAFHHVEDDGGYLIITGTSVSSQNRMMALRLAKYSSLGSLWTHLKDNSNPNIGYDIIKLSNGYAVVGETFPSSNPPEGLLYFLDNGFQPTYRVQFDGYNKTNLRAIDHNDGQFLSLVGMYGASFGFTGGYYIKTSYPGYSGCNDSLARDSTTYWLDRDTLYDNSDPNFDEYHPMITRDTLVDSLLCEDSVALGPLFYPVASRSFRIEEDHTDILIYPNPLHSGNVLIIELDDVIENQVIYLFDINGRQVKISSKLTDGKISISTDGFRPGMYVIRIVDAIDGRTLYFGKIIIQ